MADGEYFHGFRIELVCSGTLSGVRELVWEVSGGVEPLEIGSHPPRLMSVSPSEWRTADSPPKASFPSTWNTGQL